jgi:adenylate cyclase class 2
MNIEVEIKVAVDNLGEIKEKVSKMGSLIKSIRQVDDYYIPSHRDFFAQIPEPIEWLRIRTNPDKVVFEYDLSVNKKADGEQECAEEYESEISNPEEFKKILDFLDFKKIITVDKQREYWLCGDIEVALDIVDGLGSFVEAEAKGNFESNASAKKACKDFLTSIGIENINDRHIKRGYPVLILEKIKEGKNLK